MDDLDLNGKIAGYLQSALSMMNVDTQNPVGNRENIKKQFESFLRFSCKTSRRNDSTFFLTNSAVTSILSYIPLVFDYAPKKWSSITNLYDVTDPELVQSICERLLADDDFNEWDKKKGQWASAAIMYYCCFVHARVNLGKVVLLDQQTKDKVTHTIPLNLPLQQIFYGAPGTGKSHGIQEAENNFAKVIRTTFHPDSDYSTFVGAYKPKEIQAVLYDGSGHVIKDSNNNEVTEKRITYEYTPQAFTQVYSEAWQRWATDGTPVLFVIEEINRGNCAQIFGDLFQLLDRRDDGFSSYPIVPDTDLQRFVAGQGISVSGVQDARGNDISAEICNGTKLLLPPNLYIWATMNTSDQSLFPIDSAFKRRWDWKYTKIKEGKDDNDQPLGWTLNFVDDPNTPGQKLSWWDFIKKLNTIIESMTDSADKQLGYFFCKANDAKEITPEVFVGKVVFYLWNDVFKMCGFDDKHLFTYERDNNGTKEKAALTFPDFYNEEGDVDSEVAKQFVLNVMNWKKN